MLVLNKSLKKVRTLAYIRFSKVGYLQSRAIFTLFTKRLNAKYLVKDYSSLLIQVAKSVDKKVISIEILEHWQRLKLYRISLVQY